MEQENMELRQMNDENIAKVCQYEETIEQLHQDIKNLGNTEVFFWGGRGQITMTVFINFYTLFNSKNYE